MGWWGHGWVRAADLRGQGRVVWVGMDVLVYRGSAWLSVERRSGWMGKLAAPMWVEESEDCRHATIRKTLDENKWMVAL